MTLHTHTRDVVIRGPAQGPTDPARPRVLCTGSGRIQDLLMAALGETYELAPVQDGPSALREARHSAPEVIVCEHAPPAVNGIRVVTVAKSDPALFTIPVVLVWGTDVAADLEHALEIGADDVLDPAMGASLVRARLRAAVRSRSALRQLVANHTQLVRTLQALEASRARTRAIIESAHDGILLLEPSGRIESANPAARAMFLLSDADVTGRNLRELVAAEAAATLAEALAGAARTKARVPPSGLPQEFAGVRANGSTFPLECKIVPVQTPSGERFCAFLRDLTESKRLLLELQQAQKLESVGRLAAGIAHEINTPIQYIGDNTSFLKDAFACVTGLLVDYQRAVEGGALDCATAQALAASATEQDVAYYVQHAPSSIASTLEGVERVATIVRAMKEFAHADATQRALTDLNRAVQATLQVARNEYKYVADVETELGDIPRVLCNGGEVNQVLLNVIVNAAQAIAEVVKGTTRRGLIRVTTRAEGDAVVVAVSDTGPGIPEGIQGRIFDPFFTTKPVGHGSGQGLALAHGIVNKHGGRISFTSVEGAGTTFEIRLPLEPQADFDPSAA